MYSLSEESLSCSCHGLSPLVSKPTTRLKQPNPDDYVLDINNVNIKFAYYYQYSIDNINILVYQPNSGFSLHRIKDGNQRILDSNLLAFERAILIYSVPGSSILLVTINYRNNYFFKSDGKWREIDYFEYADKLKEARLVTATKEISIDTSSLIKRHGLLIGGYKYGSTYQYEYNVDFGYVARSVRYGDQIIWEAEDDTQRCVRATTFLNNYNPIGMTALIFVDEVQIVYYKFENNRWTNIDEDYYMNMVRSYRPRRGEFEIRNLKQQYRIMLQLCPRVDPILKQKYKSQKKNIGSLTRLVEDRLKDEPH